jgi:hypothetical protein
MKTRIRDTNTFASAQRYSSLQEKIIQSELRRLEQPLWRETFDEWGALMSPTPFSQEAHLHMQ